MIQKLSHLLLQVTSLERSLEFYQGFLGLEPRERNQLADGRTYVSMKQGLGLTTFPPGYVAVGSCDHIAFCLPGGIEPLIEKLNGAGIAFEGPRRTPYGNSIYFRDPDGHRLECHDATGEVRV
jgi:catechol 2,3-dioxygenase-like lactoylglutathione lyase family enzyme